MKHFIAIILLISISISSTFGQDETYKKKVQEMLELSGAKKNFDVSIDKMLEIQKEQYNNLIDQDFLDEFGKELKTIGVAKLTEEFAPIYYKYLTLEELDGIITFYKTDAGKALIEKTPLILSEAMDVGKKWGEEMGQEIIDKIENIKISKFNKSVEEDCSKFKTGEFSYTYNEVKVSVIRKDGFQIESMEGIEYKYKIKWLSNNRYLLINIDSEGNEVEIDQTEVNIYEVNGNSYKYISKHLQYEFYQDGELTKIK